MIIAKMAWGNLFLHKAKSLLLGTIMCLGIAILFVGNSLIDTAIGGLRKMFVEGFTGDLMVTGPTAFPTTIFGETAGGEQVIPHIAKFPDYETFLASEKGVAATLPLLGGQVEMGLGEQVIGRGSAFGVDVERYKNFFSGNVTIVDGAWPSEGDPAWIVISETSAAMLSRAAGKKIGPGEKIILSAVGDTAGIVIREVKVAGIVRFNQSNQQLARISLVDADTMRDLLGFASLRDTAVKLTPDQQQFVTAFDPTSLFDNPAPATDPTAQSAPGANDGAAPKAESIAAAVAPVPAWQYLLVKLGPGANASKVLGDLTKFSAGIDEGDHVQDWIAGAGTVARTAVTIRLIFDLMIFIVAVIVIMITMNVLVVSISERIPEIGTLRALGAKRRFIRKMILLETTFLAVLAGAFGLLLGYFILLLMKKSGIAAPNLFFEAIFAGKNLVPVISLSGAIKAFLWIFGMSILSSLYPIALALRIKPVVAMQGE